MEKIDGTCSKLKDVNHKELQCVLDRRKQSSSIFNLKLLDYGSAAI
jgi:hypothetical protein